MDWMKQFLIASTLVLTSSNISTQAQPNIVFIFSDDHTWQAISAYESWLKDVAVTPNIDKLAEEGVRFDRCYVTNALCGPARAVIQTGKYSHKNGFRGNNNTFDGNQQTFPKIMRQNGYQTAIIGKWHLGTDPQGFDYFDVMEGQGEYYNPYMIKGNATGRTGTRNENGYNSDVVADLAMGWLTDDRDKNKPFMLMMQFKATHRGWAPGLEITICLIMLHFPRHPISETISPIEDRQRIIRICLFDIQWLNEM